MHPLLNIALRAIRKSGDYIAKSYEFFQTITTNQKNNNILTKIIYEAEKIAINIINKSYPYHTIITKKHDKILSKTNEVQWIINVLNGTNNFIKCFPYFSTSIAIYFKNKIEKKKYIKVSVVYAPMHNELFTAVRGQGAQLNGYRLRITEKQTLDKSIIAIKFPSKNNSKFFLNILNSIFERCNDFRSTGDKILDLCYIANNRIDAFYQIKSNYIDFSGSELIILEAGGIINRFFYKKDNHIIIGNQHIIKDILTIIKNKHN
ncbi:inositol monophosphatase family protein [Candidatus Providencia siddallii]|uniref:Inositol-1-monophosphatase n=1 Tax=Candidatus Providencia siddallii TaxID=1715285 RepID=A0ABM9NPY0_9GAMM